MKISSWLRRKGVRQALFIMGFLALWELVALSGIYPPLLFPDWASIFKAFAESIQSGEMLRRTGFSLYLIGAGLGIGIVLAFLLAALAMLSRLFADLTESVVAILHPLPGIALLPIVLLWFGTGSRSIIVIIVHSVLWPLMLNTYTGFRSVSKTQLEVGRNIGLSGLGLVRSVMVPAAFPYILAGLKIAWARSWRALVAAEMVFGASGSEGGLGWLIYQHRFFLDIPGVFAGLLMIILIGVAVEDLFFAQLEERTVRRWGMTVAGG
jgi:NitT/TauT family transport system permease protein